MATGRIALLGEYAPSFAPHAATQAALEHSAHHLGVEVHAEWLSTEAIDAALSERYTGIWVAPGSPYKNMDKTLRAIQHAREHQVPCFGTCGGFQHMILEYARSVLGFRDAQHAEYDPYASKLFISRLECSLVGRELPLQFAPRSRTAEIYGGTSAIEQYYCNFGVNPEHVELIKSGPLRVAGSDCEGEVRVIELPGHPFFIGTLFVPQARSREGRPHPLVSAFVSAVNQGAA